MAQRGATPCYHRYGAPARACGFVSCSVWHLHKHLTLVFPRRCVRSLTDDYDDGTRYHLIYDDGDEVWVNLPSVLLHTPCLQFLVYVCVCVCVCVCVFAFLYEGETRRDRLRDKEPCACPSARVRARTCISQHDMLWIGRSHVFADRYPRACRLRLFLSIFCCVLDFMHTSFTVLLLQHPPPPGLSFYSNSWDHENTVRDYFFISVETEQT